MPLETKHLLAIKNLSSQDINTILETADSLQEVSTRDIKKVPTLRGRTIVNLFLEPSTRTRTSFELAAKRLSADTVGISKSSSAVIKGESLKDTAKTLGAYNVDAVVIRHPAPGAAAYLADYMDASIINAGDGAHEHPTQALLDLFTANQHLGSLKGKKIAIIGDIYHSRVARSNILAFSKMGAKVLVVGPPGLIPKEVEKMGAQVSYDFDEVIPEVDIIYMLRIQLERQQQNLFLSVREYVKRYGLNSKRLARAKDCVVVMHPGPMNRGIEISAEVADMAKNLVTDQVSSGVAVRMAVLYLLVGGVSGLG
ncbi:MAG: aspartate carbamoyltransferase catalytic subunit [Actinobacteria bacterium]|nr:MAG: aspartate carbamoyltransferase catalytic subunit [Actinomycetota bacterium]